MKQQIKIVVEMVGVWLLIAVLAVVDYATRWVPGDRPGYYEE